ncbi:gluconate 2-dehydrogenase subunit 3 family protein [Amycolatopsis sp. WQ 127309]|uniref:gluconate 2-dehydrogenase subunit 3 family protein n=1 Tax=Amycolatopsis sp. WQ 127309 TaxID=2932773 RepID=UPI001FF450A4|nr:gluconate 2-dehydrogenase subunit 3 family protein [Amycolatopsis sp. WQ 127309]UOZ06934.1 gluconate 2-dehydrogenase subunit 3 family protein [Amycolatopsis sp. WQ 127309]
MSRRRVLGVASLLPLAALVPGLVAEAMASPALRYFTTHQASVLDAATRRLVPGPQDDPLEAGHPGAAELGVVSYLDTMLGLFTFDPPRIFTGGPWSDRPAGGPDHMATFTHPGAASAQAWRARIADLQARYTAGIADLDKSAGGDFAAAGPLRQDAVLASAAFTATLFQHTIEGMYANPEYGGNIEGRGWLEIGYPGDSQPVGYTAEQLARQELSLVDPTGVVAALLTLLRGSDAVAGRAHQAVVSGGKHA